MIMYKYERVISSSIWTRIPFWTSDNTAGIWLRNDVLIFPVCNSSGSVGIFLMQMKCNCQVKSGQEGLLSLPFEPHKAGAAHSEMKQHSSWAMVLHEHKAT